MRVVEAVGELHHAGHAEVLSQTSERASAPFLVPQRRGIGLDGMPE